MRPTDKKEAGVIQALLERLNEERLGQRCPFARTAPRPLWRPLQPTECTSRHSADVPPDVRTRTMGEGETGVGGR